MVINRQVGPSLWSLVNEKIIASGPLPFSQYQELALYHPQAGFYSSRGSAGRSGDFITSPEVGPLFGRVMAKAIDRWWRKLGKPDPFFVFEAGAGAGTLAINVIEGEPDCTSALRYVTVERSAALRGEQAGRLPIDAPERVLTNGPVSMPYGRKGPLVACLSDLPSGKFTGVVIANELLDNLPVDLYEFQGKRWHQCCVGTTREGDLAEVYVPLDNEKDGVALVELEALVPQAQDGERVPLQWAARDWVNRSLQLLDKGKVVCFDYAHTTRWMSRRSWEEWLRTYRNHRPGSSPYELPGTQDITCEVAVDQLARVRSLDKDQSQAEFLDEHGLADLVADARDAWHGRSSTGDLGAMKARSVVNEGRALADPKGLGRHRVFEWNVGAKF